MALVTLPMLRIQRLLASLQSDKGLQVRCDPQAKLSYGYQRPGRWGNHQVIMLGGGAWSRYHSLIKPYTLATVTLTQ